MTSTESDRAYEHDGASPAAQAGWRKAYAVRLVITDVLALVWGVLGSTIVLLDPRSAVLPVQIAQRLRLEIPYLWVAVAIIAVWLVVLAGLGSRRYRVLGTGSAEFKIVANSAFVVLLGFGIAAFALRSDLSRSFLFVAVVAGGTALLVGRGRWRWWLRTRRATGAFSQRVLLVGSADTARIMAGDLRREYAAGYHIVGACVADGVPGERLIGTEVPVFGDVSRVAEAMEASGADTVLITGGHRMTPREVRALSWSLEPGRKHLIVAPSLTDIAGPRIHARPVAGLPLIHVETPRYEGADRYLKRAFDIVGSAALLLLFSPLLLTVAVIVATTSPGGVFFSHERIGRNGQPFRMMKFRSMVADADAMLQQLLQQQGTADTPLFKVEHDPRITPIGRFMRRYSVDEIPQLMNVLRGDMSLVGPRPQVAREVALYDNAAARRLFVKPGMTGLWQVSGRSNLGWEESVRLDLYYVENWSMTADLSILWRPMRAVVASDGAV